MPITLVRSLVVAAMLVAVSTTTASARRAAPIAHPTGPNQVVIRTSTGGGFVAPQASLGAVPSFTLYGDGTIVIPGVVPQIAPGPAIKPLAIHAVWQVASQVRIPVIGIGGITTAADALEFLLAGAAAVQLGTVNYTRTAAARDVHDGIAGYVEEHGFCDLRALPIRSASVLARA